MQPPVISLEVSCRADPLVDTDNLASTRVVSRRGVSSVKEISLLFCQRHRRFLPEFPESMAAIDFDDSEARIRLLAGDVLFLPAVSARPSWS
jgi:hypothetical protein